VSGWLRCFVVVTAAVLAAACSWQEQFFVVNKTSKPIELVAHATIYPHYATGLPICTFRWQGDPVTPLWSIPAKELTNHIPPYDQLKHVSASSFDEDSCSVRVTVEPGAAVLLWIGRNGQRDQFLTKLTTGDGKVIEGKKVVSSFRRRSISVYDLVWK